ncbi:MAG: thiamine diphosphokinase [Fidelibacterota bacterium]|nr:MAG: thiamine diphosphokinase [Candidatus Neomarinimicrobiota bacterium]
MALKPPVVILADGTFPTHHRPLEVLERAGTIICCDGAANSFLNRSRKPDYVVGDLDSITEEVRAMFQDRLVLLPSEQSSDLEEALQFAAEKGCREVTVLGAVGKRDDHTLGNLLMLWTDFGMEVMALTDAGQFSVVRTTGAYCSFEGQEVSLFPESTSVRITTDGLQYSLDQAAIPAYHKGTSNRSLGKSFAIQVDGGAVLVYQSYPPEE